MKQIIAQKPLNTISIDEIVENRAYENGIVAQVYENKVSFLTKYPSRHDLASHRFGFRRIGFDNDAHSCSETVAEVLKKGNCPEVKTFHFDSLQELAEAIVENGWK